MSATAVATSWPLAVGADVGGVELRARVHEGAQAWIYQGRQAYLGAVAVKVGRSAQPGPLEREAATLARLAGCATPLPLRRGELDGRPYLVMSWETGVEIHGAAAELRESRARRELLELCASVLDAYATLHERGVVHARVHPRHILVERSAVRIVDFGRAPGPIGTLSSPEEARVWLRGGAASPTPASEQYALAALLYLLLTGRLHAPFARTRPAVAEQILTAAPLPFARRDAEPWPALERALAKALSKAPDQRFASVREFAGELEALAASLPRHGSRSRNRRAVAPSLQALLDDFRAQTRPGGPVLPGGLASPPTCSINYGAAGIAFALYRLGRDGDAGALRAAEAWLDLADRSRQRPDAFGDGDELIPRTVGIVSPYHSASGLECVRAFLAAASGDVALHQQAIDAYLGCVAAPCANPDLTLGRSGVLLGCALLHDHAPAGWPAVRRLRAFGEGLGDRIWAELREPEPPYQGIAHGWAGIAYATLAWARTTRRRPPAAARAVLDRLAGAAEPWGRGARWALRNDAPQEGNDYWPGWCHGYAGYTFLWTLAFDVYGEPRFAELAERAAWSSWDAPPQGIGSLCCGTAGAVYALLAHHRQTGERAWLHRAAQLANRAADAGQLGDDGRRPLSLYRGRLGLALLAAELREPERASMPMFEPER